MDRHSARLPLGACSALSLSSAREAAAAIVGDVAKGKNPAAERKEAVAAERQSGRGTGSRSGCSSSGQLPLQNRREEVRGTVCRCRKSSFSLSKPPKHRLGYDGKTTVWDFASARIV